MMGAIFVDEFRPCWCHSLAWLALIVLGAVEMSIGSTSIGAVHTALSLSCLLLGLWHALAGRTADLMEGRRRLRVVYAVAIALYTVLIIAADWLWPGGLSAAPLSLANAVALVTLIFVFAVLAWPPTGAPAAPARAVPDRRPSRTAYRRRPRLRPSPMQRCSRHLAN